MVAGKQKSQNRFACEQLELRHLLERTRLLAGINQGSLLDRKSTLTPLHVAYLTLATRIKVFEATDPVFEPEFAIN